ncbi:MAG TPA: ubiquinol oxidase subunit II [Steroidobacteraceae bacterium]|nr:ubiquinol oxidase subunit II [Steroidobacteraceae bacterium]
MNRPARAWFARFCRLLPLPATLLLTGCHYAVLDPRGPVGQQERTIILTATALMLLVVVPVIAMILVFAWRYRASNEKAQYAPNWSHSTKIETVVWGIPIIIILILGAICWRTSHELDPFKPLASTVKPVRIDAVAMDWKWLFIYPKQGVASVNEVAMPVGVPVVFHITSATVMNSFFIPRLGSQIYAMANMQTAVNLLASKAGTYRGISANFSGDGFSGMTFQARALSRSDFAKWLEKAKASPQTLGGAEYTALDKPSEHVPVEYYSRVLPDLFPQIVDGKFAAGRLVAKAGGRD